MYDVTREELMAAVEAEEREWLSTDDIHPYKSRVPQTKGNTVSFPKITKFNTYLLNHYSAEIVEEINGLLYDGELAAICGVDGFHSQQLTHDRCRIDPRMTFWRVNKYEFTADLVVCECQRKSEPSANQYLSHLCERILEPPTPKVTANT